MLYRRHNLNYTIIVDKNDNFDFNFRYFALPVTEALKKFGLQAEFSGRNDVTIGGKKFSGNSQYVKKNRIMHHGCIMLDSNLGSVAEALRVKPAKLESKSTKSVRSRVTSINANLEKPVSMDEFKAELKNQVAAGNPLEIYRLTEYDVAEIQKLRDEKYATWEWNYGFSPEYKIRKETKFDGGIVTAHMEVEKGRINEIKIFGDFFGNRDISDLERALQGIPLDKNLENYLEKIHFEEYMRGVSVDELAGLLRD